MSVINEMLRNLKQRQAQADVGSGVVSTDSARSRGHRIGWAWLSLIVFSVSVIVLYYWNKSLHQNSNAATSSVAVSDAVPQEEPGTVEAPVTAAEVSVVAAQPDIRPGSTSAMAAAASKQPLGANGEASEVVDKVLADRSASAIVRDNTSLFEGYIPQPMDSSENVPDNRLAPDTFLVSVGVDTPSLQLVASEAVTGQARVGDVISDFYPSLSQSDNAIPRAANQAEKTDLPDTAEIADNSVLQGADRSVLVSSGQKTEFSTDVKVRSSLSASGPLALIMPADYPGAKANKLWLAKIRSGVTAKKATAPRKKTAPAKPMQSKGLVIKPADSADEQQLARQHLQQGDFAPAERVLAAASSAQKTSADLKLLAAQLAVAKGKKSQSISILEASPPSVAGHEDYYQLWAAMAFQQADYATAESLYQQLLAYRPNDAKTLMGLAFSMKFSGKKAAAKSVFQRALRGSGLTDNSRKLIISELSELSWLPKANSGD